MTEPVRTPYGHVFDRNALQDWLQFSQTDPICGQPLVMDQCVPETNLQNKIFQNQLSELSGQVLGQEVTADVVQAVEQEAVVGIGVYFGSEKVHDTFSEDATRFHLKEV